MRAGTAGDVARPRDATSGAHARASEPAHDGAAADASERGSAGSGEGRYELAFLRATRLPGRRAGEGVHGRASTRPAERPAAGTSSAGRMLAPAFAARAVPSQSAPCANGAAQPEPERLVRARSAACTHGRAPQGTNQLPRVRTPPRVLRGAAPALEQRAPCRVPSLDVGGGVTAPDARALRASERALREGSRVAAGRPRARFARARSIRCERRGRWTSSLPPSRPAPPRTCSHIFGRARSPSGKPARLESAELARRRVKPLSGGTRELVRGGARPFGDEPAHEDGAREIRHPGALFSPGSRSSSPRASTAAGTGAHRCTSPLFRERARPSSRSPRSSPPELGHRWMRWHWNRPPAIRRRRASRATRCTPTGRWAATGRTRGRGSRSSRPASGP